MDKIKPPTFLTTRGKRRFTQLAKQLPELTEPQESLLALLCQSWDSYLTALDDVRKNGQVIRSGERLFVNPAVNIINEERKSIMRLSKVFGLSPDEDKIIVQTDSSPLEDLIG